MFLHTISTPLQSSQWLCSLGWKYHYGVWNPVMVKIIFILSSFSYPSGCLPKASYRVSCGPCCPCFYHLYDQLWILYALFSVPRSAQCGYQSWWLVWVILIGAQFFLHCIHTHPPIYFAFVLSLCSKPRGYLCHSKAFNYYGLYGNSFCRSSSQHISWKLLSSSQSPCQTSFSCHGVIERGYFSLWVSSRQKIRLPFTHVSM